MAEADPSLADRTTPSAELLADYNRNPVYERRIVVFYDILGWREITEKTEGIAERIGCLRREILLHSRVLHMSKAATSNVTTFSDNVVISAPVDRSVPNLLRVVTLMQMMTQSRGLLIRGGVTIGGLVHDSECVFGPGLNRAYDLERKRAKFPRIVLDLDVLKCGDLKDFISVEDDVYFLDPFKREFRDELARTRNLGANGQKLSTEETWKWEYDMFVQVMQSRSEEKERAKVAWVVDRLAHHAGLPPARTYAGTQGSWSR